MKQQSRRRFIGSCLAAALGVPVIRGGCKKKEETSPPQSGNRDRQSKTPPVLEGIATIDPTS
jgi:hypothetical protein